MVRPTNLIGIFMKSEDWYFEEVRNIREKIRIFELRQLQMVSVAAAGFATILSFSSKIPTISLPIILFILMLITENFHYVAANSKTFLNEYLILYSKKYFDNIIMEDIYKNLFSLYNLDKNREGIINKLRNFIKWAFYPFIALPLLYLIFSIYFVFMNLDDLLNINCTTFFFYIIVIIIISLGYFYMIGRNIRLRIKTINKKIFEEYQNRIQPVLE
jgi:hypothetical protein